MTRELLKMIFCFEIPATELVGTVLLLSSYRQKSADYLTSTPFSNMMSIDMTAIKFCCHLVVETIILVFNNDPFQ